MAKCLRTPPTFSPTLPISALLLALVEWNFHFEEMKNYLHVVSFVIAINVASYSIGSWNWVFGKRRESGGRGWERGKASARKREATWALSSCANGNNSRKDFELMNINNADELKQTARGKGREDRKRGKKVGEKRKREVESRIASFLHCSCNGKLEINKTYNSMTSGQP